MFKMTTQNVINTHCDITIGRGDFLHNIQENLDLSHKILVVGKGRNFNPKFESNNT